MLLPARWDQDRRPRSISSPSNIEMHCLEPNHNGEEEKNVMLLSFAALRSRCKPPGAPCLGFLPSLLCLRRVGHPTLRLSPLSPQHLSWLIPSSLCTHLSAKPAVFAGFGQLFQKAAPLPKPHARRANTGYIWTPFKPSRDPLNVLGPPSLRHFALSLFLHVLRHLVTMPKGRVCSNLETCPTSTLIKHRESNLEGIPIEPALLAKTWQFCTAPNCCKPICATASQQVKSRECVAAAKELKGLGNH